MMIGPQGISKQEHKCFESKVLLVQCVQLRQAEKVGSMCSVKTSGKGKVVVIDSAVEENQKRAQIQRR